MISSNVRFLVSAHCPLHITSLDFDEAANELAKALDY